MLLAIIDYEKIKNVPGHVIEYGYRNIPFIYFNMNKNLAVIDSTITKTYNRSLFEIKRSKRIV